MVYFKEWMACYLNWQLWGEGEEKYLTSKRDSTSQRLRPQHCAPVLSVQFFRSALSWFTLNSAVNFNCYHYVAKIIPARKSVQICANISTLSQEDFKPKTSRILPSPSKNIHKEASTAPKWVNTYTSLNSFTSRPFRISFLDSPSYAGLWLLAGRTLQTVQP